MAIEFTFDCPYCDSVSTVDKIEEIQANYSGAALHCGVRYQCSDCEAWVVFMVWKEMVYDEYMDFVLDADRTGV